MNSGCDDGCCASHATARSVVSIAGLSYFYLSNNYTLSAIFGRDLMSTKAKSERLSHMCDVILGYVLRS